MTDLVTHFGPDWVVAEMPPGYQTRMNEIRRLAADLQQMGRFARLLWQVGPELGDAVRDAFVALKYEADLVPGPSASHVAVRLDGRQRLLLIPSTATTPLQKKSAEVSQAFQLMQEVAEEGDRVVLVTNVEPQTRPADRPPAVAADALALVARMGVVHLAGPTLFQLWKLSLESADKGRAQVGLLHGGDGGTFELPASLLRLAEMKL